jgi:L-threonylcarbamoyladenylate synthase
MQAEITKTIQVLKKGGTILYPTDTVWGIGCDATSTKAVSKVYNIKSRVEKKSLIILVDEVETIKKYVDDFPEQVADLINSYHKPLTIVFPKAKNLAKNILADDGTVGIRVVKHEFCKKLIKEFGKPIVSTSANISGVATPILFREISEYIKGKVDYIVDCDQDKMEPASPSTVIKIDENGSYELLRG